MRNEKGQIALILVLAATVAGALVISLAGRSTTALRTENLSTEKVKAFKAAESGIERALLDNASVNNNFADKSSFSAEYINEGTSGYVSDLIEPGEVVSVLLTGADSGVNQLKIYFSSESALAAIKVTEFRANEAINQYLMNSFAFDSDGARKSVNNFSDPVSDIGFNFRGASFTDRATVNVNAASAPKTKFLRILVLYSATKIGIEPIGGNLPGQSITISSTGSYSVSGGDSTVKKKIELRRGMEKVPVMFDSVLYSNAKLDQ